MPNDLLIYTFRTFPHQKLLEETFSQIFIFSKLHQDLQQLEKILLATSPKQIIGIARSATASRYETQAINQFHGNRLILQTGPKSYPLHPLSINLPPAASPTNSFCNWTAYHIAKFIVDHQLNTKLSFLHLSEADLPVVLMAIKHLDTPQQDAHVR